MLFHSCNNIVIYTFMMWFKKVNYSTWDTGFPTGAHM